MREKSNSSNLFFKKPSIYEQKLGKLTAVIEIRDADNLPRTSVAMDEVAKAKYRDDLARSTGKDDYALSLKKLFDAFDAFIREYSKGKYSAGSREIYDLSKSHHLTILLLWQIRHTWTHSGGIIDDKCKRDYEKIIRDAYEKGVKPRINLPLVIPINFKFSVDFNNYLTIEQCIFEFMGERIPKKDLEILKIRASIADLKIESIKAHLYVPQGHFLIDLAEALECGCSIDPISGKFTAPPKTKAIYDDIKKQIILKPIGKSFSAERLSNNNQKTQKGI